MDVDREMQNIHTGTLWYNIGDSFDNTTALRSIFGKKIKKLKMKIFTHRRYALVKEYITFVPAGEDTNSAANRTINREILNPTSNEYVTEEEYSNTARHTEFIHEIHYNHSVISFKADIINGATGTRRTIETKLESRERAIELFQQAMRTNNEAAMLKETGRWGDRLVMDMGNISQDDDIEICFEYLIEMPPSTDLIRTVDGQERQRTGAYATRRQVEADGTEQKLRYKLHIPMLPKPRNRETNDRSQTDIRNLKNNRSTLIEIEVELFTNALARRPQLEIPEPPANDASGHANSHGYKHVYDLKPSDEVEDIRLYLEFDQEGLEQELSETTGKELKKDLLQESDNYLENESLRALAYRFNGSFSLQVEAHVERNENYKPSSVIPNMNETRKEYVFVVDCSNAMQNYVPQVILDINYNRELLSRVLFRFGKLFDYL